MIIDSVPKLSPRNSSLSSIGMSKAKYTGVITMLKNINVQDVIRKTKRGNSILYLCKLGSKHFLIKFNTNSCSNLNI